MARGWYGPPKTWQEAARRSGALHAMGEPLAARFAHNLAVQMKEALCRSMAMVIGAGLLFKHSTGADTGPDLLALATRLQRK